MRRRPRPATPGGGTPLPNEGHLSGRDGLHDDRHRRPPHGARPPPLGPRGPEARPWNPRFSSGPCAKPPSWSLDALAGAPLGRSHRAPAGKGKLRAAIDGTREVLGVPDDHRIGIVPASDTGAVEMAMWTMLGQRPVEMVAWESFGEGWVTDAVKQLRLDARIHRAPYGQIVDMRSLDYDRDVVFTWNGTTSGVRVPGPGLIPRERGGLTICDATSAAFAQDLPWDELDVSTFSWQKALGGEAAHGMLILSPRAVERLESYAPNRPLPKIFRLTKGGKLIEGIFRGRDHQHPLHALRRGLPGGPRLGPLGGRAPRHHRPRGRQMRRIVWDHCAASGLLENLARDPATRSNTSVCLRFTDPAVADDPAFAKAVAKRLEAEGAAYDVAAYRDAPPGLRLWCGPTVEAADVRALMPWIDWAYAAERAAG